MDDVNVKAVGLRILVRRRELELTQGEAAKEAGISQKQLSLIEAGKAPRVQATTIVRLARVLKTSTDYLLGVTEKPESETDEIEGELQPAAVVLVGT